MTPLSFTQAAHRLHLAPAEFAKLRRTFPLPSTQSKGGPTFEPETLDKWFAHLPFCVRQSLTNRKRLNTQTCQKERDREYMMRLWGYLRQTDLPLGAPAPSFILHGSRFELVDHRGRTQWRSLREAIEGLRLALSLARTRQVAVLKAA